MHDINYENYSERELRESLGSIDKDNHPENYQRLLAEIEKRKNPSQQITEKQPVEKTTVKNSRASKNDDILSAERLYNLKYVAYILFLNSALLLFQVLFAGDPKTSSFIAPMVIDVIFGILLLKKPSETLVTILAARTILGLIFHSIALLLDASYYQMIFQIVYCSALLFLMYKTPQKKIRLLSIAIIIGIQVVMLSMSFTNVILSRNLDSLYALSDQPADTVDGVFYDYTVTFQNKNWFIRDRESALKENPMADQWAVNPEFDAHVLVIGESLEQGAYVNYMGLKEVIIENVKNAASHFKYISEFSTANEKHKGLMIHTKATVSLIDVDYLIGLYIIGDKVFQIFTFCKTKDFKSFEEEFINIINNFEYSGEIKDLESNELISQFKRANSNIAVL